MHGSDPKRESRVGPLLIAVAQSWRRVLAQRLACEGLSDATALPLFTLRGEGDGLRQNELAEKLGLEGTSVVRVLDSLERDGYLRRQEDARDRRAKRVFLTPEGSALAARVEEILGTLRADLLGAIDMRDIETTERVLASISDALAARLSKRKP